MIRVYPFDLNFSLGGGDFPRRWVEHRVVPDVAAVEQQGDVPSSVFDPQYDDDVGGEDQVGASLRVEETQRVVGGDDVADTEGVHGQRPWRSWHSHSVKGEASRGSSSSGTYSLDQ